MTLYVSNIEIESGTYAVMDQEARTDLEQVKNDIALIQKYIPSLSQDNYRLLVVSGVENAPFTTINDAITKALTMNPTISNPVTILILPGIYQEKIVLNDVHGISFVGIDRDNTVIQENGVYPDCVVHVQGDIYFKNLTFKNLTGSTYIVHDDPSNTGVTGEVRFENCVFDGGSNGIGHGSGNSTTLKVIRCLFKNQSDYCMYAHNSPYAASNQNLFLIGNIFTSQKCLQMDDAGNTYGQANTSQFNLYFKDNLCQFYSLGSVLFRKNTNDAGQNLPYIKSDNMLQGIGCNGNTNIPSMNCNFDNVDGGIQQYNVYIYIPPAGADNYSHVTIPVNVYTSAYNVNVNSLTIPGVGTFNSDVGVENKHKNNINFLFNNSSSIIGKVAILNFDVIIGG